MSTSRGIRTLVGAALASSVILLGGCSSSGTTGGKSSDTNAAGSSTSSSSPDSKSSSDNSSASSDSSSSDSLGSLGGVDPACTTALQSASDAMSGMSASDPAGAKKAMQDIATKMHTAAGQAKKPATAAAINKLADDYAAIGDAMSTGKMPDTAAMTADAQALGTACRG